MKTLLLVRHAKAAPGSPDRARPLDSEGRLDAVAMGRLLNRRGVQPDRLMASPALRALTTAQLVAAELGRGGEAIVIDERLYASSVDRLLALIQASDDRHAVLMLFGHNPEFAELAQRLSGTVAGMVPGAVATLRFEVATWSEVGSCSPIDAILDLPRGAS